MTAPGRAAGVLPGGLSRVSSSEIPMSLPLPFGTVTLPDGPVVLSTEGGDPFRFESVESAEMCAEELRRCGVPAELCSRVGAVLVALGARAAAPAPAACLIRGAAFEPAELR